MKKKLPLILVLVSLVFITYLISDKTKDSKQSNADIAKLREQHANYLKNSPFKESLKLSKKERKAHGIPPNKYFERQWELTMNPATGRPNTENLFELQESLQANKNIASKVPGSAAWNNWEERGPNNVGGRTRAIMFDPNDATNKRVFAGGVSGGLWVNNDITLQSSEWTEVNIPQNLAISCITYDPVNTNVFYLGTGESYVAGDVNGNGLWKSIDGGLNWEKSFGGITGETTFKTNIKITVNSPSSIQGEYQVTSAAFGPKVTSIAGDLVLANDGTDNADEGCNSFTNADAISGKIAVVRRGSCTFVSKVKNAEEAGAIAVLVVNNAVGPPISLGGEDDLIKIPSVMISEEEGTKIIEQIGEGVNVTLDALDSPFSGSFVTPGIQHINDVKVRDLGDGKTEVLVAVAGSYYSNSSPSSLLGSEQYGLYKSVDEGESWASVEMPLTENGNRFSPNDIEIDSDNTIWVSTINSVLYRDGGGTVLASTDGENFTIKHEIEKGDRTQIAVSKLNPGVVYVLAELSDEDTPIYMAKSVNGFEDFSSMSLPNDIDNGVPTNDFTRGQAFYNLMIEIDPSNDEIVYAGGIDLFRTQNGGANWNQISKWSNNNNLSTLSVSLVHADQHILVFNPSDPNQGVFGTDGGIYFGNDLENASSSLSAISSRNNNYNTLQFYKGAIGSDKNAEKLIAGAQDNGTHLINNANSGVNSSSRVSGGDGAYTFIDKDNEYMITSYVYNNYYYHDYNSGNYVYEIDGNDDDGDFINPAALDSENDILYTTGKDKIYRHTIGPSTASKSTLTNTMLTSSPTAFKPSNFTTTTLFVGTENGKLFKIANANSSSAIWTEITGDQFYGSISCIEQGPTEDDIIVTFHNYGIKNICYSQDGGESWEIKEGNLPDIPVKAVLMSPINSNEVILGTDLGVWATTNFNDSDPTWFQTQNGMKDVQVTSFDLRKSDNTVLATTYGRGMFTAKFTVDDYNGDDDNDSVINGLDLCPDTPTGEEVDSNGCSNGQLDDDGDNVQNSDDLCKNTPAGATVTANGCLILSEDNFEVEVKGETCPDKDNGQILITSKETYNFVTTINEVEHNFTSQLTASDLEPGTYDFCITVDGEEFEQCYTVEIMGGETVSAKSSVTANKASIEILTGTPPFKVFVNGNEEFESMAPIFNLDVKHGDIVEVKTAVNCEGVYSKGIETLEEFKVYPNPTKGLVQIALPIEKNEVVVSLFNSSSQLISEKSYAVKYGKIQLDLTSNPNGLYIVKIHLEKPVTLKIIKQ